MVVDGFVLAADLGGTKAAAALVTGPGDILCRKQEATCQSGPRDGIAQIVRLARAVVQKAGLKMSDAACMGVGVPAVLEPGTDRVMWAPKLSGWGEVDLCPALQDELGLPVFAEYDGHTTVLGEWWVGSGKGCQSVVALIVGTGIGGGMILDGRLYRGFNRLAGAAGWLALTSNPEAQDERARAIGFWDALASGPGLAGYAQALASAHTESSLWSKAQSGALTPVEIFAAARQGDELAAQILNQFAGWLGLGIANIVSLLNPEVVILCGGVGSRCQALLPRIRQVAVRWAQPFSAQSVRISVSQLGGDAGLYGAAWGAWQRWKEKGEQEHRDE